MDESKTAKEKAPRKRRTSPQMIAEALMDLRTQDAVVEALWELSPRAAKLLKESLAEKGA
jgi:hypothetical protein